MLAELQRSVRQQPRVLFTRSFETDLQTAFPVTKPAKGVSTCFKLPSSTRFVPGIKPECLDLLKTLDSFRALAQPLIDDFNETDTDFDGCLQDVVHTVYVRRLVHETCVPSLCIIQDLASNPSNCKLRHLTRVLAYLRLSIQTTRVWCNPRTFTETRWFVAALSHIALSKLLLHKTYFGPGGSLAPAHRILSIIDPGTNPKSNALAISMYLNIKCARNLLYVGVRRTYNGLVLARELVVVTMQLLEEFLEFAGQCEDGRLSISEVETCMKVLVDMWRVGATSVPPMPRKGGPPLLSVVAPDPCRAGEATPGDAPTQLMLDLEDVLREAAHPRGPSKFKPRHQCQRVSTPTPLGIIDDSRFLRAVINTLKLRLSGAIDPCTFTTGRSVVCYGPSVAQEYEVWRNNGSRFRVLASKVVDMCLMHPVLRSNAEVLQLLVNVLVAPEPRKTRLPYAAGDYFGNKPVYCRVQEYWDLGVGIVPHKVLQTPLGKLRDELVAACNASSKLWASIADGGIEAAVNTYHPYIFEVLQASGNTKEMRWIAYTLSSWAATPEHRRAISRPIVMAADTLDARWSPLRKAFVGTVYRAGVLRTQRLQAARAIREAHTPKRSKLTPV